MHHKAPDPATPNAETEPGNSQKYPVFPCAPCVESKPRIESEPWIPESKLVPLPKDSINSIVRNILLRNPLFPKFYADILLDSAPNSHEAKILRTHYQKIIDRVNDLERRATEDQRPIPNDRKSMPTKICTHIKVTGVRCGSPALYGEQFCYFHQHAHRGVRKPPQSRLHPIAILEDEESIQASLMEVINALMRNTIDLKRAELILRALHIAVKNARRVKLDIHKTDMVREIPQYAPPQQHEETAAPSYPGGEAAAADDALDIPYTAAIPPAVPPTMAEQRRAAKAQADADHQASIRARLVRTAKSVVNGPALPQSTVQDRAVPPHNFNAPSEPATPTHHPPQAPPRPPQPSSFSKPGQPQSQTVQRKPQVGVKTLQKEKERERPAR